MHNNFSDAPLSLFLLDWTKRWNPTFLL